MTGTETTKVFADKLSDLINEKKTKKHEEIANEIGVTKGSISKYINDNGEAGINSLVKIARYFNVSTDYLLGLTPNKISLTTEENRLIRSICDYTGLKEYSIKCLKEMKDSNLTNIINEFIDFLIENASEEILDSMDDVREISSAKSIMSAELFHTVKDMAGDISVGEMFSRMERDSQTFLMVNEVFELESKIDDLETIIDGLKFKISKFFNKLIDDFALSNTTKEKDFDSIAAFDSIYNKDIYSNLLELKKYAEKLTKKDKGDACNGNHKKEE